MLYDWMQDELSRQVFLARKRFAEIPNNKDLIFHGYSETLEALGLFYEVYERPEKFDDVIEKMRHGKYIIYGAGYWCKKILQVARITGTISNCIGVWDKNPKLNDTLIDGRFSVTPPPISSGYGESDNNACFDYVLVSASEKFKPHIFKSMCDTLQAMGVSEHKIIHPYFALFNHTDQYFDKEIILSYLKNDEVFIDGGCYDFYTSNLFIDLCNENNIAIKKIYAFEPDSALHELCKQHGQNIPFADIYASGLWSKDTTLYFSEENRAAGGSCIVKKSDKSISVVALDSFVPKDERVTFVKMDIEGAELEALKGAEQTIIKDKPKLAICLYHKLSDYVDIPLYLKSIVPEYRAYMRHYQIGSSETVLYCIP